MKLSVLVFWFVMPCGLVCRYQHFGEMYCLYLQSPHDITIQKTNIDVYKMSEDVT
jgi:hypothetical protein